MMSHVEATLLTSEPHIKYFMQVNIGPLFLRMQKGMLEVVTNSNEWED